MKYQITRKIVIIAKNVEKRFPKGRNIVPENAAKRIGAFGDKGAASEAMNE